MHISYEEILCDIKEVIANNQKYFIAAINPKKIIKALQNQEIFQILNSAHCQIPDGYGVVWATKVLEGKSIQRITGVDLLLKICESFSSKTVGIFLYGGEEGVAKQVKKALYIKHPEINIVDYVNGYSYKTDEVIKKINNSKANIVVVAMGSPKQEKWIYENIDRMNANIFIGVGGSFDVIAGRVKRAPLWMQTIGFEWLYRVILTPYRIKDVWILIKYVIIILSTKMKLVFNQLINK